MPKHKKDKDAVPTTMHSVKAQHIAEADIQVPKKSKSSQKIGTPEEITPSNYTKSSLTKTDVRLQKTNPLVEPEEQVVSISGRLYLPAP